MMTPNLDEPDQFFVGMPANQASSIILLNLYRQMTFNEVLIADPDTPEALHDYRIAVRKTRALLARLEHIIAAPALLKFRNEFAALMHKTGPLRDLQVCHATLTNVDPDGEQFGDSATGLLHLYFHEQSRQERNRLIKYFASKKHIKMKDDWHVCLHQSAVVDNANARANEAVSIIARKAVRQAYQITVRQADKAGRRVSATTLHKLRKQCKDLRYLLEMFSEVFPAEPRIGISKQLKQIQRRLGKMQDLQVLHLLVREYAGKFEDKLDRQNRKAVKLLLKQIKTDKRELKQDAAKLVKKYPQRSADYIGQLLAD